MQILSRYTSFIDRLLYCSKFSVLQDLVIVLGSSIAAINPPQKKHLFFALILSGSDWTEPW